MDAQGFRALAQRCHELSQIEAEAEAAEGRHPQMHDDRSDEGPKFLRAAAKEMRSLAERDSLELRRMAADLERAADKILERAV